MYGVELALRQSNSQKMLKRGSESVDLLVTLAEA